MAAADDHNDRFGPIDFMVVEFPSGSPTPAGFERLLEEIDAGRIRILDLEFVTKSAGQVQLADPSVYESPALAPFIGASSGLLDRDDLEMLAAEMTDGTLAALVLYEELSILTVMDAWHDEGARVILEGHLAPTELEAALDATEA